MGEHFFMTRDTKKILIICGAKQFSIIYYITVWGIGKLAPLLSEKVPCQKLCEKWKGGQFTSPKWSGHEGGGGVCGGVHLVG